MEAATRGRCDELEFKMKEEGFDARTARCGPRGNSPFGFALGDLGDPHDADAVKLALEMEGVDVNAMNSEGQACLYVQCSWGRSRNAALLLADPRVDPNLAESAKEQTPLLVAAAFGRVRCVTLLLADERVDPNLSNLNGETPLNAAAMHGRDRCVELFFLVYGLPHAPLYPSVPILSQTHLPLWCLPNLVPLRNP